MNKTLHFSPGAGKGVHAAAPTGACPRDPAQDSSCSGRARRDVSCSSPPPEPGLETGRPPAGAPGSRGRCGGASSVHLARAVLCSLRRRNRGPRSAGHPHCASLCAPSWPSGGGVPSGPWRHGGVSHRPDKRGGVPASRRGRPGAPPLQGGGKGAWGGAHPLSRGRVGLSLAAFGASWGCWGRVEGPSFGRREGVSLAPFGPTLLLLLGQTGGPLPSAARRGVSLAPLCTSPGRGRPVSEKGGAPLAPIRETRAPHPRPPRVSPDRGGGATGAPSLPAPPHAPPHPAPGTSHRRRPRAPLPGPSPRGAGRSMARWAVLALLLGLLGSLVPAQGERLGAPGGATPGRATGRAGCWGRVPGGALWAGGVLGTRSRSGGRLGGSGQWGGTRPVGWGHVGGHPRASLPAGQERAVSAGSQRPGEAAALFLPTFFLGLLELSARWQTHSLTFRGAAAAAGRMSPRG